MASAAVNVPKNPWIFANPWSWMGLGLALTAWAWGLKLFELWSPILVGLGVLAIGIALTIGLRWEQETYLGRSSETVRFLVLGSLMLIFLVLVVGLSLLLLMSIFRGDRVPYKPGGLVVIWLLVAPMSLQSVPMVWRRWAGKEVTRAEEASALLALAALGFALACWGLEWDTLQMVLAVMAFVALAAAPLAAASVPVRRTVISLAILLHFGGITTAVLAAPPFPWIVAQVWTRIYRPYLECMYLNNAYHFYSPDPGPARYLWFRQIFKEDYKDEKGNARFRLHGHWYKVPAFDDAGRPKYGVALIYQRYLSLTENTVTAVQPSFFEVSGSGPNMQMKPADFYARRIIHSPSYEPKLGEEAPQGLVIPIPNYPLQQQYHQPLNLVKNLVSSYSQHVCRIRHPEHPEWPILGVKVYQIIHSIPPDNLFIYGEADPRDPVFFQPYFMGMYDPDGVLIDPREPFLYWLLPIVKDNTGRVYDYCRYHAGDPNWQRLGGEWVGPATGRNTIP